MLGYKNILLIILSFVIFSAGCDTTKAVDFLNKEKSNKPVAISGLKTDKNIALRISFESDYGIQIKAENKISLYELKAPLNKKQSVKEAITGLKPQAVFTKLQGEISSQDGEYFSSVKDILYGDANYDPKKSYAIEARLYYCSFSIGICNAITLYQTVL